MSQIRLECNSEVAKRDREINFLDDMNFKTLEKLRIWAFSRVF